MKQLLCTLLAAALAALAGCGGAGSMIPPVTDTQPPAQSGTPNAAPAPTLEISPINELEDGFSSAQFAGDDGFEDFLTSGGASSDGDVIRFLAQRLAADFSLAAIPSDAALWPSKVPRATPCSAGTSTGRAVTRWCLPLSPHRATAKT